MPAPHWRVRMARAEHPRVWHRGHAATLASQLAGAIPPARPRLRRSCPYPAPGTPRARSACGPRRTAGGRRREPRQWCRRSARDARAGRPATPRPGRSAARSGGRRGSSGHWPQARRARPRSRYAGISGFRPSAARRPGRRRRANARRGRFQRAPPRPSGWRVPVPTAMRDRRQWGRRWRRASPGSGGSARTGGAWVRRRAAGPTRRSGSAAPHPTRPGR